MDFGTLSMGDPESMAQLGVLNDVLAPADDLAGSFLISASNFGFSGFDPFSDLLARQTQSGLLVRFDPTSLGIFNGQITLSPLSENGDGFSGPLSEVVIVLSARVVPEPSALGLLSLLLMAGRRARSPRN